MAWPGLPVTPDHRGDADDAAVAAPHHAAHGRAREAEVAVRLTCEHLLPVLVLHAHREAVAGDAGVVRPGCRPSPERRLGRLDERVDAGGIARDRQATTGALAQLGRQLLQRLRARAGEHDGGALRVQGAGDRRRRCRRRRRSPARSCRKDRTWRGSLQRVLRKASRSAGAFERQAARRRRDALDHAGQHLAGADLDEAGRPALARQPLRRSRASARGRSPARPAGGGSSPGSSIGGGGDVGDQRRARRGRSRLRQRLRPSRRRPAASAGSGRARRRAAGSPRAPQLLGRLDRRVDRRLVAARSRPCRRCCRWRRRRPRPRRAPRRRPPRRDVGLRPDQRGHRPLAHRHGALHGLAAQLQQPGGVGQAAARRPPPAPNIRPANGRRRRPPRRSRTPNSGSSIAHHRQADRHQRRLGVLGQGQVVIRPLAHQPGEVLAQRVVDLLEHVARGREGVGQVARPCRPPGCPAPERRMPGLIAALPPVPAQEFARPLG